MKFPALSEVRAYWEGLRQDSTLPRREAIDPRGIAGALDCVFMAERIGTGLARFRIAGMKINDCAGTEARGLPLSILLAPAARLRFSTVLERVFTGPATAEIVLEAERGLGRPALEGRMLLMPLISTRGEADLCLGCLAMAGDVGRAPRRFDIVRAVETVLGAAGAPGHTPHPVHELAEPAAPPPRPPSGGRPALRLVRPGD